MRENHAARFGVGVRDVSLEAMAEVREGGTAGATGGDGRREASSAISGSVLCRLCRPKVLSVLELILISNLLPCFLMLLKNRPVFVFRRPLTWTSESACRYERSTTPWTYR